MSPAVRKIAGVYLSLSLVITKVPESPSRFSVPRAPCLAESAGATVGPVRQVGPVSCGGHVSATDRVPIRPSDQALGGVKLSYRAHIFSLKPRTTTPPRLRALPATLTHPATAGNPNSVTPITLSGAETLISTSALDRHLDGRFIGGISLPGVVVPRSRTEFDLRQDECRGVVDGETSACFGYDLTDTFQEPVKLLAG